MEYVRLGKTGLKVSRLCLGCMSYGVPERGNHLWSLPEEQSRPFISRALELGIIKEEGKAIREACAGLLLVRRRRTIRGPGGRQPPWKRPHQVPLASRPARNRRVRSVDGTFHLNACAIAHVVPRGN